MLPSSQKHVITVYKLLGIMGVESGNFSSSSLKVRGLHGSLVIISFEMCATARFTAGEDQATQAPDENTSKGRVGPGF